MNEFELKDGDGRVLRFAGQLIARTENEITLTGEFARKIKLSVYGVEGGGYVAEARFESNHPDEPTFCDVEDMDSFDDIDKFFYVFDLYENICNANSRTRAQREECDIRTKRLVKEYEKVLYPFLKETNEMVARGGFQDRHKEPKKKKTGIWNMFKSETL